MSCLRVLMFTKAGNLIEIFFTESNFNACYDVITWQPIRNQYAARTIKKISRVLHPGFGRICTSRDLSPTPFPRFWINFIYQLDSVFEEELLPFFGPAFRQESGKNLLCVWERVRETVFSGGVMYLFPLHTNLAHSNPALNYLIWTGTPPLPKSSAPFTPIAYL